MTLNSKIVSNTEYAENVGKKIFSSNFSGYFILVVLVGITQMPLNFLFNAVQFWRHLF